MTDACRRLGEPVGEYFIDDYLTNLVATVIDFQTHTTAVERALEHFSRYARSPLGGLGDLVALMARWPADQGGNTALARHLWGYGMWTRAQMLRDLVAYFVSIDVTDQASLRRWATDATFERDFKGRVAGLGPAVFQWLVMRQGVDTVKPDVHVHRFVAGVLGRRLSDAEVIEIIVTTARRIGRPAHRLDWAIWEASRNNLTAAASGLVGPPQKAQAPDGSLPRERREPVGGRLATFVDNDGAYLAWIVAHADGYVLNSERNPALRYLVLNRATCHTVAPRDATDSRTWTSSYRKTCATTATELVDWAETQAGPPSHCRICRPIGVSPAARMQKTRGFLARRGPPRRDPESLP